MPDGSTHRDYRGIDGVVSDAFQGTGERLKEPIEAAEKATRRSNAVSTQQVMRTEREPAADEGVRAFGAPMSTGARERQSTDKAN